MPVNPWTITRRTALLGATAVVAAGCAADPEAPAAPSGSASSKAPKPSATPTPSQTPTPTRGPVETPVTAISTAHGLEAMWPNEPIDIVVEHGTVAEVVVTDTATGEVFPGKVEGTAWRADRGALYLRSNYRIDVTVHDGNGDPHPASANATTVSPGMVVEVDYRFASDPDVGNGMPIWVRFDLPIAPEQRAAIEATASITTNPSQEGSWGWNDESTLWWRPKEYWIPGSTAHVEVNAAGQAGADTWVLNNAVADYTFGDLRIIQTNIDSHTATCLRNGEVVKVLPVSMGKPGYETMTGTKLIMQKDFKTRMDSASYGVEDGPEAYNLEVYYAQRITWSGEYFHAAPWADYAHGSDNVSHGCTGLSDADAAWLFEFTRVGDPAEFTGSTFPVQPHQTWGCWLYSWEDWQKQSAIPKA